MEAGAGIGEMSLYESLSDSLSCFHEVRKKFLTLFLSPSTKIDMVQFAQIVFIVSFKTEVACNMCSS